MSTQEKITAIRAEIKKKEQQLYLVHKEANAWSKGGARSHFNMNKSKLFVESQRKEISELKAKLLEMEEES